MVWKHKARSPCITYPLRQELELLPCLPVPTTGFFYPFIIHNIRGLRLSIRRESKKIMRPGSLTILLHWEFKRQVCFPANRCYLEQREGQQVVRVFAYVVDVSSTVGGRAVWSCACAARHADQPVLADSPAWKVYPNTTDGLRWVFPNSSQIASLNAILSTAVKTSEKMCLYA